MSGPPAAPGDGVIALRASSYGPADQTRPETARALQAGPGCPVCGQPLTGRQRSACSARCRAALSRRRTAAEAGQPAQADASDPLDDAGPRLLGAGDAAESATVDSTGPSRPPGGVWRFRVVPAGRRFGWKGEVYGSHPKTGLIETEDEAFAEALRKLTQRDMIAELP
jgi:hypothetical protein